MSEEIPAEDAQGFDVWYSKDGDQIRIRLGGVWAEGHTFWVDIRDAVYFRYLLDGAINDYERAVGK